MFKEILQQIYPSTLVQIHIYDTVIGLTCFPISLFRDVYCKSQTQHWECTHLLGPLSPSSVPGAAHPPVPHRHCTHPGSPTPRAVPSTRSPAEPPPLPCTLRHRKAHSSVLLVPFYFFIMSLLAALGCCLGARAFSQVECAAKTIAKIAEERAGGPTGAQSRGLSSGQSSWEAFPACASTASFRH